MRILLRAPLLTSSGYGVHARQIFEAVESIDGVELDVECLNWGKTPWLLNQETNEGLIGRIMSHSRKIKPPYDLSIQVQLPDEWDSSFARKNIGVSAIVETDRCNPSWIESCNKMDLVVVPSEFTKGVIKKSGVVTTNIEVVPEWFNQYIINDDLRLDKEIDLKTEHNFLILGQLGAMNADDDRKNIYKTIKWVAENFKNRDDVGIIIKTNMGKNTKIDKKLTQNILNQMKNHFKDSKVKLYLIHGTMTDQEIAALYRHKKIKCLVSATRGEGYGLPLIEAAASGMPIIVTNWSGHLDFLQKINFLAVDYDLKEINESRVDNRIFFPGFRWAEPKEESFKKALSKLINDFETFKNLAENEKKVIIKEFSKENIINTYKELIKKCLSC